MVDYRTMKHLGNTPKTYPIWLKVLTSAVLTAALIFMVKANQPQKQEAPYRVLASRSISLEKRWNNKFVNDVFKDNILLNLAYLQGTVASKNEVNWDNVKKAQSYEFTLEPGKTFSFHEDVLPQYKNTLTRTTNAHFNSYEGFKSDGYLVGDGVCHLASILYWVARDAQLDTYAPVNHNFAVIAQVPKEYGVAIYSSNQQQNLYITNNKTHVITFKMDYDGENLTVNVVEPAVEKIEPHALANRRFYAAY